MIGSRTEMLMIIEESRSDGWVLEPAAKRLFSLAGFSVPRFMLARTPQEALDFIHEIGYPVVCKIVSPLIIHKSDVGGVAVGIKDDARLIETFRRFEALEGFRGVLVEEMISGIELIMGAKNDLQFGPMILLGMGGTGVEIYRDVVLKMAPLTAKEALVMYKGLKAHRLLEGYRGTEPAHLGKLAQTLLLFSSLVMELEGQIASIDVNPLLCSSRDCIVADVRMIIGK